MLRCFFYYLIILFLNFCSPSFNQTSNPTEQPPTSLQGKANSNNTDEANNEVSQNNKFNKLNEKNIKIEFVELKDLALDTIEVNLSITTDDEFNCKDFHQNEEIWKIYKKEKSEKNQENDSPALLEEADVTVQSCRVDENRKNLFYLYLSANSNFPLLPGEKELHIINSEKTTLVMKIFSIPERSNSQPYIDHISRRGAEMGDTIEVEGSNFNTIIENNYIQFDLGITKEQSTLNEMGEGYPLIDRPLSIISIPDKDKKQKVVFSIKPFVFMDVENNFTIFERFFGKIIKFRIFSKNYPTNYYKLVILGKLWKVIVILFTIIVTGLFISFLSYISKTNNLFHVICLDPDSNRYSLAYFQAFAWTITLFFSYFYVALARTFLIRDGNLPNFNLSLIALMGISLAGGITSKFIDKKTVKPDEKKNKPEWKDLVSTNNGSIDIYKIQLFGFTMICIFIYIINLFQTNIWDSLPEIHPSLHALFGTTQGGYLVGKISQEELKKSDHEKKEEPAIVENKKETQKKTSKKK